MQEPPHPPAHLHPQQRPQPQRVTIDKRKYQVIYPQYIDAYLTPKEGRRLSLARAVPLPTMDEMIRALQELGYREIYFERRGLPASQGSNKFAPVPRGCLRLAIKEPADAHYIKKSEFDTQTRAPRIEAVPNKHQLLIKIAEKIKEFAPERPPRPPNGPEFAAHIAEQQGFAVAAPPAKGKHK